MIYEKKFKKNFLILLAFVLIITILLPNFCSTTSDDLNRVDVIELKDVISAIRICAGDQQSYQTKIDVNLDGKIGLEEAIFEINFIPIT